ncbi:D-alanyl-D-alanine carboxypeptidase [Segnochrobactrum spirostomi]|uniref:D-alanyl-D-alanine carboxypeptidase n=1 Tax=Segnochrobactrum spirostomi TaxID=2608987 RepID=A0A6A7XYC3_9HYPH|nr:D-alanyl-D-alanine carboxypeptidase [Segnochrobactrum spirostomi]MQT11117.1 D-alanyl-D-alanine carboxypeptidase [Segnochrobactrum spirostomi]
MTLWRSLRGRRLADACRGFVTRAVIGVGALAMVGSAASAGDRSAAYVLDVSTGRVLYAKNADAPRYPASLTKMMTLYILFEELRARRLTLDTQMRVSALAAAQEPTKLSVKAGSTVAVRDCMYALVTLSANDCAVVISERVSGSMPVFAQRMTATAHRIGMRSTTFRNANGLPIAGQASTAHDLAMLGLALQRDFPQEYKIFSTRVYSYKGRSFRNHNHLLGKVEGVDGIKTGFIRASGFNIVTSAKRGNRRIIAVVMGGATSAGRDAQVARLIETYLPQAQPMRGGDMMVASNAATGFGGDSPNALPTTAAPVPSAAPRAALAAAPAHTQEQQVAQAPQEANGEPLMLASYAEQDGVGQGDASMPSDTVETNAPTRTSRYDAIGAQVQAAEAANATMSRTQFANTPFATGEYPAGEAPATKPVQVARAPSATDIETDASTTDSSTTDPSDSASSAAAAPSGWQIQIGAMPDHSRALAFLKNAKSKGGRVLASAEPYTEKVRRGGTTLYRARFVGFDSERAAKAACSQLKKHSYECMTLRQ